jgi:hypothetical protein
VCGPRVGDGAAVATAVEPGAQLLPALGPETSVEPEPETVETRGPESDAGMEPPKPATELVTELDAAPELAPPADLEAGADLAEAARLDAVPVTGHGAILDATPEADQAELVADLASERTSAQDGEASAEIEALSETEAVEAAAEPEAVEAVAEPEAVEASEPEAPPEPQESLEDVRQRKMTEIAALLEFAGRCEEVNAARAAVVYGEAIVACLDVTEDPLGAEPVREDLLRGFDGLSLVLERQGLPEEALAVVDDAASLGLLNGADGAADARRTSLRDRREGLRHILYGDSAQL